MNIKQLVIKAIDISVHADSASFKSGVHARFIPISEKWGLKYFLDENQRNENYNLQSYWADRNMAPMVGPKIRFNRANYVGYGYLTEICPTIYDLFFPLFSEDIRWTIESLDIVGEYYNIKDWARTISRELELQDHRDTHVGNIGWCERLKKWVVIDFSTVGEYYDRHCWQNIG